ncbi:hypothetical protein ACQY0O_001458 [Thecaphora frezii]
MPKLLLWCLTRDMTTLNVTTRPMLRYDSVDVGSYPYADTMFVTETKTSTFSIPPTLQLSWRPAPAQQPLCRAENNANRSVQATKIYQYHNAEGCLWRFTIKVPMGDVQLAVSQSIDGALLCWNSIVA